MFGRYILLKTPFITDFEYIKRRKQLWIDTNNQNDNENRKPYNYRVSEKILVRNKKANKYEEPLQNPLPDY